MIRPSSLKNVEICSDFEQLQTSELHPVTEAGTRLHAAMETNDTSHLADDERWLYDKACQARASIMDQFEDCTVHKELKLEVDGQYAGMVDHFAMHGTEGVLIDYKFGYHRVDEPHENIQFQDYAVKLFERYPELETLEVCMIAPRRDEVSRHIYFRTHVPAMKARCAMVRARAGTGQLKASGNCQYCAHLATCREAYDTFAIARHQDELLPAIRPGMDLSNPIDLERALEVRPVIKKFVENWDKAVTESAKEILGLGFRVGEYELATRQGRSKIVDLNRVKNEALQMGLSETEINACMEMSLSKLMTSLKDYAPPRKKTQWQKEFKAKCGEGIAQGEASEYIRKRRG